MEESETPEESCLRELKEETGLSGVIEKLVGVFLSESSVYKSVLVIGFKIKKVKGKAEAGDDSEEIGTFALSKLPPIAFKSHQLIILPLNSSQIPINRQKSVSFGCDR